MDLHGMITELTSLPRSSTRDTIRGTTMQRSFHRSRLQLIGSCCTETFLGHVSGYMLHYTVPRCASGSWWNKEMDQAARRDEHAR